MSVIILILLQPFHPAESTGLRLFVARPPQAQNRASPQSPLFDKRRTRHLDHTTFRAILLECLFRPLLSLITQMKYHGTILCLCSKQNYRNSPGFTGWIGPTGPKATETLAKLPVPSFTRRVRQ